jgi:phosphomethylpyrimidine synthase
VLAAHIGDLVQGNAAAYAREVEMGKARRDLDWNRQFALSLFPDRAKEIHERDGNQETCSMCGDLCAVKMVQEIFGDHRQNE